MSHPSDFVNPPHPENKTGEPFHMRSYLVLLAAVTFGLLVVWFLRMEWTREFILTWFFLLAAMFAAASSMRRLETSLPGTPIEPSLQQFPSPTRRLWGLACIVASLLISAFLIIRLWPDIRQWQGTPLIWLAALLFALAGAWLIGAIGRGSPRAATALTFWADTRRNRWLEIAAFFLIFSLAIFLRVYRLDRIPPGIYVDETNGALDALRILEGQKDSPFGTGWYGTPTAYIYYMAFVLRWLGTTWTSLKVISLIPAILTIPAVYLAGRVMFGPVVGLMAMFLMSVSRWHLSMSRWGWNETAPPFFQALSIFFLVRGLRDRRAIDYALSGLITGLSVYTYLSARLAALTLVVYVVAWFLLDPSGLWPAIKRSFSGIVLMGLVIAVAIAPIMVTYVTDPFAYGNRVSEISIFRDIRERGSVEPLVQNLSDIIKFFHQTGDMQGKHNLPGEPMLDPVTGLLFAFGLAYSILAWRDHRRTLLVIWLVIGLAGSFMSSNHESPQSYRSLTALPAAILLAADMLDHILRATYAALRQPHLTLNLAELAVRATAVLGICALAFAAIWETGIYFGKQANSIHVIRGFNPVENGVARETLDALQAGQTIYLSPTFSSFSPVRFLVYGAMKDKTGGNTLDNPPYGTVVPELTLPFADNGRDVMMLLDSRYWQVRDYITSLYPDASLELVLLGDRSPVYMRALIPQDNIAALQGLQQRLTFADGHIQESIVSQVEWASDDPQVTAVTWDGIIHLDHGDNYQFLAVGGLKVFIDGEQFEGERYLGRGNYAVRLEYLPSPATTARFEWSTPDAPSTLVPPQALFHIQGRRQGLLASYYPNMNWEGAPVFHQVTPFILLAWGDEQPIMPAGEFSARFTGDLVIRQPGAYRLRIEADDGARLTLDGQVLGEGLIAGQPNGFEATIELVAGNHPIQIDYFQQGGGSTLQFLWAFGDQPLVPVPPSALIPAVQ